MKQIINGKLYDTNKIEFTHTLIDTDGSEYLIGKTSKGAIVATDKDKKNIFGPEQTKILLGYRFPDTYIELFGEVEEG